MQDWTCSANTATPNEAKNTTALHKTELHGRKTGRSTRQIDKRRNTKCQKSQHFTSWKVWVPAILSFSARRGLTDPSTPESTSEGERKRILCSLVFALAVQSVMRTTVIVGTSLFGLAVFSEKLCFLFCGFLSFCSAGLFFALLICSLKCCVLHFESDGRLRSAKPA